MDKQLYRFIQNHKGVPFVAKIISGTLTASLSVSEDNGKYLVHPYSMVRAKRLKDYIVFDSRDEAQEFVDTYKDYYDDSEDPEDMDQEQFVKWREGSGKFKFSGTVERVG